MGRGPMPLRPTFADLVSRGSAAAAVVALKRDHGYEVVLPEHLRVLGEVAAAAGVGGLVTPAVKAAAAARLGVSDKYVGRAVSGLASLGLIGRESYGNGSGGLTAYRVLRLRLTKPGGVGRGVKVRMGRRASPSERPFRRPPRWRMATVGPDGYYEALVVLNLYQMRAFAAVAALAAARGGDFSAGEAAATPGVVRCSTTNFLSQLQALAAAGLIEPVEFHGTQLGGRFMKARWRVPKFKFITPEELSRERDAK